MFPSIFLNYPSKFSDFTEEKLSDSGKTTVFFFLAFSAEEKCVVGYLIHVWHELLKLPYPIAYPCSSHLK